MAIFWSEIGSGFLEPGATPTPRIPRNIPRIITFYDPPWESKQPKLQDVRSSMLDCYSPLTKSPQLPFQRINVTPPWQKKNCLPVPGEHICHKCYHVDCSDNNRHEYGHCQSIKTSQ